MTKKARSLAITTQKEVNEILWKQLRYILSTNYDVKSEDEAEIWLKTSNDDVLIEVYPSNDGESLVHVTVWSENGGYGAFNRSQELDTLPKAIEHINKVMQAMSILVV